MAATLLVLGMGVASAAETPQAKDTKAAPEAWLGVYSQTLTPELREGLNYNGSGALVSRVVDGSPAEKAGVKSGDVIVGINTTTVASATDLTNAIGQGADAVRAIAHSLTQQIEMFEPRLRNVSIRFQTDPRNPLQLTFHVGAMLHYNGRMEPVTFDAIYEERVRVKG